MRFNRQTLPTHTEHLTQSFLVVKLALFKTIGMKTNGIKIPWSPTENRP